jgi:radical SAM superfamily enzyme YgiQ (UPF0313 family)
MFASKPRRERGDPDFFNGPTHALRIVEAVHEEFPALTYDVTIKVEHLLAHAKLLPVLKETGCLFVTTAAESVDDRVLAILEKGHTREDFFQVVRLFDEVGLSLAAFTPWTTLDSYLDLLKVVAGLGLIRSVAPVQLAIRLLIPPGSRLLELSEIRALVGPLDEAALVYPWSNSDSRIHERSKRRFRPWCNGREPSRMISSLAKYGDLLTISPGVLPHPCWP